MSTYSERHLAQLIRRMMIQKVKQSKKVYTRKNKHKDEQKES
jgi:hypothetical protein